MWITHSTDMRYVDMLGILYRIKTRTLACNGCSSQLQPNIEKEDLGSKSERINARQAWEQEGMVGRSVSWFVVTTQELKLLNTARD